MSCLSLTLICGSPTSASAPRSPIVRELLRFSTDSDILNVKENCNDNCQSAETKEQSRNSQIVTKFLWLENSLEYPIFFCLGTRVCLSYVQIEVLERSCNCLTLRKPDVSRSFSCKFSPFFAVCLKCLSRLLAYHADASLFLASSALAIAGSLPFKPCQRVVFAMFAERTRIRSAVRAQ